MPSGDWGPGIQLRPVMFNVTLDSAGHIAHCGVGYDVVASDGRAIGQSGSTWHSPGLKVQADPAAVAALETILATILNSAVGHEGAIGIVHAPPPKTPGPNIPGVPNPPLGVTSLNEP